MRPPGRTRVKLVHQLFAIHLGHLRVSEDKVYLMRFEDLQCSLPMPGAKASRNRNTGYFDCALNNMAHYRGFIDNQDAK